MNRTFDTELPAIVVPIAGDPFVALAWIEGDGLMRLCNARAIAFPGTKDGLGDLLDGPLPETKLGRCIPRVFIPVDRIAYLFPVAEHAGWGINSPEANQ